MRLSNRLQRMATSPIRKLIPYAKKAEENGLEVIPLNIGQPDIETPPVFFEAIEAFDKDVLAYADSQGTRELLETSSEYLKKFDLSFSPQEIIITNGASEGLIFAISSICDFGEEILSPEPYYSNYNNFAELVGVHIVPVTTYAKENFRLPPKEVWEERINDKTKAILLSNPGNPTGRVYTTQEMDMLRDLALQYGLIILSDEVYKEFVYGDNVFHSFGSYPELDQHVVLIDSISKKYSCCGARIGMVASKNKKFMENVFKLAQSRLCVATLDQIGAAALRDVSNDYIEDTLKKYTSRRDTLYRRLMRIPGVVANSPEGAFYNIVQLPIDNAETFCIWVLENVQIDNKTVLFTPAESFYKTPKLGRNEVRISYCVSEEKIEMAMDLLEEALRRYPGSKQNQKTKTPR